MKIGIIDADLIGRKKHRFPNLACMKISNYHKQQGHEVELLMDYESIIEYDKVYISKVFTDTPFPTEVLSFPNVEWGGTGFYFDKAPKLDDEIEHTFPDYHLYDKWVKEKIDAGENKQNFKAYTDYSIGFLTRGCFRKCKFCVNQNYDKVHVHSPLEEFLDVTRPKICMLDDNFFGYSDWKSILNDLKKTNKKVIFKQGLDERLLTDEKCEELCSLKYDGEITFAFDNVEDYELIEKKLKLIRKYTDSQMKFYILCAFDRQGKYDKEFWKQDVENVFKRIELLNKYQCIPYIMRFEKYNSSPYKGLYVTLARWCNQPSIYKKKSLREFCNMHKQGSVTYEYLSNYEKDCPQVAKNYFDMKWENYRENVQM